MRTYIALVLLTAAVAACERHADTAAPAPAVVAAPVVGEQPKAPPTGPDPWADSAPKVKEPLPHPFFWSAEKAGKTTYLLGTFHTGIDAEVRLPALVWTKLDAAPAFAMETDLTQVDLGSMARSDGKTLHADIGDDYWKKLEAAVTPPVAARVDRMKPMVAATFLEMKDLPSTPPMDGVLLAHARGANKHIVYLEAADKQQKLLEKYMTARTLKMMLDHASESKQHMTEFIDAYIAGDADLMNKLTDGEATDEKAAGFTDAEIAQQNEDMLFARNASWIDELVELNAKEPGAFVAVGAAHLIGKKSVLELLAAKGFTIKRIAP